MFPRSNSESLSSTSVIPIPNSNHYLFECFAFFKFIWENFCSFKLPKENQCDFANWQKNPKHRRKVLISIFGSNLSNSSRLGAPTWKPRNLQRKDFQIFSEVHYWECSGVQNFWSIYAASFVICSRGDIHGFRETRFRFSARALVLEQRE